MAARNKARTKLKPLKDRSHLLAGPAALALGLGASLTPNAAAFDPSKVLAFSAGPVTIRPHVSLIERYDDNIYYMPDTVENIDDYITMVNAGLSFSLGKETTANPWLDAYQEEANFITVDYSLIHFNYWENNYLDGNNHLFTIRNRLKGNHVSLRGSDRFNLISGLIGGGTTYRLRVDRLYFSDQYILDYNLSEKTRFYLMGNQSTVDYDEGTPFYDVTTWRATGGFGYRPFTRTFYFGEAHYGQALPSPNQANVASGPSMETVGGYLGIQGRFRERLMGMVKAGYEVNTYSDGSPGSGTPIVEASLSHRFRQNTFTTLTYSRQDVLSAEYAGVAYTYDQFQLKVDQRFGSTGRFAISLSGSMALSDYGGSVSSLANRQDTRYFLQADINYMIRLWMLAGLSYEFESFSSNTEGIVDYDVNRVTLKLSIGY